MARPCYATDGVDEVVFAATHNSMSNVEMRNWMFPQQNGSIRRQLQAGIRGLLIDVHNGVPVEGIVRTDLEAEAQSALKIANAVGDSATAVAVRIRNRLTGEPSGPPRAVPVPWLLRDRQPARSRPNWRRSATSSGATPRKCW